MPKKESRLLNVLSVLSVIILIATILRTLIYWFIGIDSERIFRIELFIIWAIAIVILIVQKLKTNS